MRRINKGAFIIFGWTALMIGILGVFLPLLPSTPFIILSAFLFSKGSQRMHRWLLSRPYLGKIISDWENEGVINKKAKIQAIVLIVIFFSLTIIYVDVNLGVKTLVGFTGLGVSYFILSRPSASKKLFFKG